jgi:hypothetical protein
MLTKAPEALAQAATQAAQAAVQQLSGEHGNSAIDAGTGPTGTDTASGPGPGGGETTPASGGPDSPTPAVMPSTGPTPVAPTLPGGALPDPVQGSPGPGGVMPMGAMTHGAGSGAAQQRAQRAKHLVVPRTPHTEAVTGKVNEDRIARSASPPGPPDSSDEDRPPLASGPHPVVRRITMASAEDDSS